MDCPCDTSIESKQFKEKFVETNLEKTISIDSSLRGVKHSQSVKKLRKSKKQSATPFGENLDTKDFIEAISGEVGAT